MVWSTRQENDASKNEFLIRIGLEANPGVPYFYVDRFKANKITIIALYVDEVLLAGNNTTEITWMKADLSNRFEMKDLGETRFYLSLEVARSRPLWSSGLRKQTMPAPSWKYSKWRTAILCRLPWRTTKRCRNSVPNLQIKLDQKEGYLDVRQLAVRCILWLRHGPS